MRSLEAGARSIQAGNSFLIFPEGTRSQTASLLPSRRAALMALKAQAPIVPVAIQAAATPCSGAAGSSCRCTSASERRAESRNAG